METAPVASASRLTESCQVVVMQAWPAVVHFGGGGVGGFFNFHWFVPGTGGFFGAWGYYDGHNDYGGGGVIGKQW